MNTSDKVWGPLYDVSWCVFIVSLVHIYLQQLCHINKLSYMY